MAWAFPEGAVLGVFGKRPEPGAVKTRLASAVGPELAADVHTAMLFDLLDLWDSERFVAPGGRRVLVYSPADAGPWFDPHVPASFALQPQSEGDLGQRLHSFFAGEFEDGATRVVAIGSDSPTLDPTLVISAFLCLESRDLVLGPSTDGGYYLVGCRPPVPPIFEGIDWSTAHVLSQTIDLLRNTRLSLSVLPPWYDVDTLDDLQVLAGHLYAMRRSGLDPGLPRTEAVIDRLGSEENDPGP
ncbi:MAG TPA: TIGR04282 family arsenosugar biosynthesis glycosyltransferase [Isosphaeraceae bacterium]|nr:TIGR04282 family arsenosugar biosynthesis glycosyltransferase [Isosphaeraceae bacterium]